ncbi:MAG TPA: hypothetical protein VM733_08645 [Thermoanaerobaculia bacterium]|nr:hypothetical protein [Thermoanaerobaculia bacterium]
MSSTREIDVRVDPSVHSVEIILDDERVGLLRGKPWKTRIDLGHELAPHELVAIARDAEGNELARDVQFINVPRPQAEVGVMLQRDRADITWQHIGDKMPTKMKVKLGDKVLAGKVTHSVKLPPVSPAAINVLTIDLTFEDGSTAHREAVFGGVFAEEMPAELTATIVRERAEGRKDKAACFRHDGKAVAASEVELSDAMLIVVRHPDTPGGKFRKHNLRVVPESRFMMKKTFLRYVWPTASGSGNSELFMTSNPMSAKKGVRFLLLDTIGPKWSEVRLTDAVAIAGTEALREPRRRAVLLVLNGEEDQSRYHPETVRKYLERIGVPLYVWSLAGPVDDSDWGEVEDVSKNALLEAAIQKLQSELDQQRVAWLPLDPYDALHAQAAPDCAWEPLAK